MQQPDCFIRFSAAVGEIPLPERFTFPFYYEPHRLAELAAKQLQQALEQHPEQGKAFGVLVVRNTANELAFLAAFSGTAESENPEFAFVPPVFDDSVNGHFFAEGRREIESLYAQIHALENAESFIAAKQLTEDLNARFLRETEILKQQIQLAKAARKVRRTEGKAALTQEDFAVLTETLGRESLQEQYELNALDRRWKKQLAEINPAYHDLQQETDRLKEVCQSQSEKLERERITHFTFSDQSGNGKSLFDLFGPKPPSGAGACPAPKLLQYAFLHEVKPIAFAEFWWGPPPGYDIRKHGHFYPACRGNCEPILQHLLNGIETDESPVLVLLAKEKTIETVYEDEFLAVIHKPAELLSIPGGTVQDSVETRMRGKYPDATGMLIVHRLDMSTSGLMVIAKTKDVHEQLQRQFLKRTVKKRYVALLDGIIEGEEGVIELPLIVNPDDRPRQLVSFEHGKPARTRWKVIKRINGRTLVHFFPETGRTHQLRIHAAHPLGLNAPIVGDELYGEKADRLYLHAEELEFLHPVTGEAVSLVSKSFLNISLLHDWF